MSDVVIPSERVDILLQANHETAVILNVLKQYIEKENDSYETRLFSRGQLVRLSELCSLMHSAVEPDIKGDDIASMQARLHGFHFPEDADASA